MTRVRTLVVEDEPLARRNLVELLAEVDWIESVGAAEDGLRAVAMIDELKPDLVFLDIQLPEITGLEVLDRIEHQPAIVFTTAFDKHAVTAFELEALDYLLKPFGRERLHAALQRVKRTLESRATDPSVTERARDALGAQKPLARLFVRDRGKIVPVLIKDIVRLEAEDDYVAVIAGGRRSLAYLPLSEFEKRLDPERFLRVHRSHIVNLDHVVSLNPYDGTRYEVEMRDGTKVVASRSQSRRLRDLTI